MKNKQWFTFVELIIVITIISILWTIWFMSYNWYISQSRDASRVSQITSIYKALESYRTKWFLPFPAQKVTIFASWAVIAYQWYAWEDVLNSIWYQDEWKDPKDEVYFTYYLTKDLRRAELMTFLEDEVEVSYNIVNKANAFDYSWRIPKVYGNKLWILLESWTNAPIQEIPSIVLSGLDIVKTTSNFVAYISDDYKVSWTWSVLSQINPNTNCKRILETWWSNWDWNYTINPTWINVQVYCDMTTDWWWWTLVHKTTDNLTDLTWSLDTTEWVPSWNDNNEYRLSIDYWKYLSTEKAMARNIRIDWLYWDDIEEGYINSISISWVTFSNADKYKIFNSSTTQNTCTSWTNYWNWSCCSRCVNYNDAWAYWNPIDAPMIVNTSTSYTWSAIEWAWWSNDASFHRLSKMWIFLK